jgi:hypothetical protein
MVHRQPIPPRRDRNGGWWFLVLALFAAAVFLTPIACAVLS